jgi:hypothetical protein
MKYLLLALLLIPTMAQAQGDNCLAYGLYAFALIGCPQEQVRPKPDLSIPLCRQPGFEQYAASDYRCYDIVPQDPTPCYAWDCPVPYDYTWEEPISGRTITHRGDSDEIDAHYRAARESLGQALEQLSKKRGK